LRLRRRIALAEKVTHADIFAVHSERLIAQGPLVLCILSLLAIYLKPTQPALYVPINLLFVVVYSAFAIALLALTSRTFLCSTMDTDCRSSRRKHAGAEWDRGFGQHSQQHSHKGCLFDRDSNRYSNLRGDCRGCKRNCT